MSSISASSDGSFRLRDEVVINEILGSVESDDLSSIFSQPEDSGVQSVHSTVNCPRCHESISTPMYIYQRPHGQPLCKACTRKVKDCSECRDILGKLNTFTLEQLGAFEMKIPCPYKEDGCTAIFNALKMVEHRQQCKYREILCDEIHGEPCNTSHIPYRFYIAHLRQIHRSTVSNMDAGDHSRQRWNWPNDLHTIDGFCHWPIQCIHARGHWFLLKVWAQKDRFNISIVYFGTTDEAEEFSATVYLGQSKEPHKRIEHKFPFLDSFRRNEKDDKFFCLEVPKSQILQLGSLDKNGTWNFTTECFITQRVDEGELEVIVTTKEMARRNKKTFCCC